jgi:hypothetical protein
MMTTLNICTEMNKKKLLKEEKKIVDYDKKDEE